LVIFVPSLLQPALVLKKRMPEAASDPLSDDRSRGQEAADESSADGQKRDEEGSS
jgi:hypothetical protein